MADVPQDFQVDDLSDAVDELATGVYLVHRPGVTTFTNGKRVAPAFVDFTIRALVAPTGGRALERLPEGLRTHETISIFTKTELRTANALGEADVVEYVGDRWQVQSVERWQQSGNFWVAMAQRASGL